MPRKNQEFNWSAPCAYDADQKEAFHRTAKNRLKKLADELGFAPGTYDLRSEKAGVAISGEVSLRHDRVHIQVSQPLHGPSFGILIHPARARGDFRGGQNWYAPLSLLDDPSGLAARVRGIVGDDSLTARPEIDADRFDRERLCRVAKRLRLRADSAAGEYRDFFRDRLHLISNWRDDIDRGLPLTPDRREGLLEFEHIADPHLGAKPYRISGLGTAGRLEQVALRVLGSPGCFYVSAVRGAEGEPYTRLSKEQWADPGAAEKALLTGAWTQRQSLAAKRGNRR